MSTEHQERAEDLMIVKRNTYLEEVLCLVMIILVSIILAT